MKIKKILVHNFKVFWPEKSKLVYSRVHGIDDVLFINTPQKSGIKNKDPSVERRQKNHKKLQQKLFISTSTLILTHNKPLIYTSCKSHNRQGSAKRFFLSPKTKVEPTFNWLFFCICGVHFALRGARLFFTVLYFTRGREEFSTCVLPTKSHTFGAWRAHNDVSS
jgi:hypothetical protein